MGTRSGDIDPAIPRHLAKTKGLSFDQIDAVLNKQSGLKGLCGDSDMRAIQTRAAAGDVQVNMPLFFRNIDYYLGSFYIWNCL